MFQKARESAYLESTSLLAVVVRWRKPLLIVVLSATLASVIFSSPFFIKPKFRSTVIFFPTASNSISNALSDANLLAFGKDEQVEQMLQILNSDEIRNSIVQKYDLMQHYGIDPASEFPMTALIAQYEDNISFTSTKYVSVRIDVMDTDPQTAANIANDIASLVDSMKTKIQRQRAVEALKILENEYHAKELLIQKNEDSLKWLRGKGIMDYNNQASIWNEEYAKSFSTYNNELAALEVLKKYRGDDDTMVINTRARIGGAAARIKTLQPKLDELAQYGGANISLTGQLYMGRDELNRLKMQYDKLKIDAEQNLPHKFIINKAVKAEQKSYPIRWLIVLVSFLCSFILALIVILVIERSKEVQYRV